MLGREVREEDVEVVQPWAEESIETLRQRLAQKAIGRISGVIVIPQRAKFESGVTNSTIWLDVNPEVFIILGRRYKTPVWQLGVGCLYDPRQMTTEENNETPQGLIEN